MQRRLTVILAADVVGYSRLMEADEAATYERVKACRTELFEPEIAKHSGRIFKLMGDGLLAEFDSIVEAVEYAVSVQREMAERNRSLPSDQRIDVRMGINLGEVIIEGDDLLGDGVNIAARLEQLAEPGGICVSAKVAQEVERKLDFAFESLGEHHVKNIATPVSVYAVRIDGKASRPLPKPTSTTSWKPLAMALAVLVMVAAIGGGWWLSRGNWAVSLPGKPSIAVLPFDNIGNDKRWGRFADGITEDTITDLAHSKNLFVIARNSTEAYRGKSADVRQVGHDLGVQYVLEGSIQPAGDKIRVTAQLVNATTGDHIWSERYDRPAEDLFAVQNEVTQRIASTLLGAHGAVANAERVVARRKPPNSLSAFDLYLLGMEAKHKMTPQGFTEAEQLFRRALSVDPDLARAYVGLVYTYSLMIEYGLVDNVETALAKQMAAAKRAVELDPDDGETHLSLGLAYSFHGNLAPKLAEFERAEALAPNNADILMTIAWSTAYHDNSRHPIELAKRAVALNPLYPDWYNYALRNAYFLSREFDKAIKYGLLIRVPLALDRAILAISYAYLGKRKEAERQVLETLRANPSWTVEKYLSDIPIVGEAQTTLFLDGARKAGLPACIPAGKLKTMPHLLHAKTCDEERAKSQPG